MGDWLHQLPANVRWMQVEHAYLWDRHVTLKSFWRLLLQGREAGENTLLVTALTWASLLAVGGSLAWAIFRGSQPKLYDDRSVIRDRLIGATITAMPLLMPFYFDYDLLLLAVPATLYAAERIRHPDRILPEDRWLDHQLGGPICLDDGQPPRWRYTHTSAAPWCCFAACPHFLSNASTARKGEAVTAVHPSAATDRYGCMIYLLV